jgi:alpha-tubulin suppressor-like RCC1 family protein
MKKIFSIVMVLCLTMSFFACQKSIDETSLEQKIASGDTFSLVINEEGELFGFGNSLYGVLANGVTSFGTNATPISLNQYFDLHEKEVFKAVYAGESHAYAITTENRVFTWGNNFQGQTGITPAMQLISSPMNITDSLNLHDDETIVKWAQADFHTIILTSEGRVLGWGRNSDDNLGTHEHDVALEIGSYVVLATNLTSYFTLSSDESITDIGAYYALTSKNRVFGWGETVVAINEQRNVRDITSLLNLNKTEVVVEVVKHGNLLKTNEGRYIDCITTTTLNETTIEYASFDSSNDEDVEISALFAAYGNVIVIDPDHQVWITGLNHYANLGTGNTFAVGEHNYDTSHKTWLMTFEDSGWAIDWQKNEYPVSFAMSEKNTIMITSKHRIFVFGDNTYGQIGNGTTEMAYVPVLIDLA